MASKKFLDTIPKRPHTDTMTNTQTVTRLTLDDLRGMAKRGAEMEETAKRIVDPVPNPLGPNNPRPPYVELLGNMTAAAANEMLIGLDDINPDFNRIYMALDAQSWFWPTLTETGNFSGSNSFPIAT
jgi:hypothetical protein